MGFLAGSYVSKASSGAHFRTVLKPVFCAATATTAANERKVSSAHLSASFLQGCPQHIATWACSGNRHETMQVADSLRQLLSLSDTLPACHLAGDQQGVGKAARPEEYWASADSLVAKWAEGARVWLQT